MSFLEFGRKIKNQLQTMKKDQYLIVILTGILLLVITIPTEPRKDQEQSTQKEMQNTAGVEIEGDDYAGEYADEVYATMLEEKLEHGLSCIAGAGRVKVMLTLKSGAERVILKDVGDNEIRTIEQDAGGGSRTVTEVEMTETTIYTENGGGAAIPYVSKSLPPQVEGVTVICEGGENSVVRSNITDAVKALFPVEAHKIKVVRMAVTKTNSGKETIER